MEPNKILNANLLDIIFEGRNKAYGAYDLRSTYNSRIRKAMIITGAVSLLFMGGVLLANNAKTDDSKTMYVDDVVLQQLPEEPTPEPIPEQPQPEPVQRTIAVTIPRIVRMKLSNKQKFPTKTKLKMYKLLQELMTMVLMAMRFKHL